MAMGDGLHVLRALFSGHDDHFDLSKGGGRERRRQKKCTQKRYRIALGHHE
jgi:hypothetical protein